MSKSTLVLHNQFFHRHTPIVGHSLQVALRLFVARLEILIVLHSWFLIHDSLSKFVVVIIDSSSLYLFGWEM